MEYYVVGQIVRLTHSVVDDSGAAVNPTSITVTVTLPDGTTSGALTPTNTAVGSYRYDYVTAQAGRHTYRWNTSGPVAPDDGVFDVHGSPRSILGLEEVKAILNKIAPADDEELRRLAEAATAAIERHLDKAVIRRTVTERRNLGNPSGSRTPGILQEFALSTRPILSITSVTSADGSTTWNPADMAVSESGVVRVLSGSIVWGPVDFVYVVGMVEIPAEYGQAQGHIIQHIWQNTQRGQKGSPRGGLDTPGAGFTSFGYALPNAAMELLGENISGIA